RCSDNHDTRVLNQRHNTNFRQNTREHTTATKTDQVLQGACSYRQSKYRANNDAKHQYNSDNIDCCFSILILRGGINQNLCDCFDGWVDCRYLLVAIPCFTAMVDLAR